MTPVIAGEFITANEPALWELLYGSLGFHIEDDEATGFSTQKFCEALCASAQPVWDLVRERPTMPAWAVMLDPQLSPSLEYLAQFVGVQPTPEMTLAQLRAEIEHPTSWRRGQPESIQIAVRRTLKPVVAGEELLVIIHSRTPAVGEHYVRTLLSQTPSPEKTKAAIRAALPAWEVENYEAIAGVTVEDVAASTKWVTDEDLAKAFPSVQALAEILPTEL
jgi:hypothetical protein